MYSYEDFRECICENNCLDLNEPPSSHRQLICSCHYSKENSCTKCDNSKCLECQSLPDPYKHVIERESKFPMLFEESLLYLQKLTDNSSTFQDGQFEAIESCITPGTKTLLVQKTGWGKSAVYFIAAKLLIEKYNKITIIVSPLLSLARNQILNSKNILNVETINSSEDPEKIRNIQSKIRSNKVNVLLVTPERFSNQDFKDNYFPLLKQRLGLLVIDEAHCISAWGHDFRPSYMMMTKKILPSLETDTSVLFTTATADEDVINDITRNEHFTKVIKGDLLRKSLSIHSFGKRTFNFAIAWFKKNINFLNGSGIIYVLTVDKANAVAQYLRKEVGISALAYHGRLEPYERIEVEQKLLNNDCKVVVATSALGMGFDKPDLGFLIHLGMPKTLTDYYQQIGRAGRKLENADCILMSLPDDNNINDYFIDTKIPEQPIHNIVLSLIPEEPNQIFIQDLKIPKQSANSKKVKTVIQRLELDGYISENENGSYTRIKDIDQYDLDSVEPLLKQARLQLQKVEEFLESEDCLMKLLLFHFQQEVDENFECKKCSNCLDVSKFITPNKSDIETIPDITELEEKYVNTYIKREKNVETKTSELISELSDNDNSFSEYDLQPDGYIDHALSRALREYSKIEAEKRNIPAYGVFTKKVVNGIVEIRPKTLSDLYNISGLGKVKIEEHGEKIIELVEQYED